MNISILTVGHHLGIPRIGHFYPLYKWKHQFKKEKIFFRYFSNHSDPGIMDCDVVLIDSRYLREKINHEKKYDDFGFIKVFMEGLKSRNRRILFFDNSDASGCRYFELIDFADRYVAKQLFKNRSKHAENEGLFSYRPYVRSYKLDESQKKAYLNQQYTPCPEDQLNKLKVGWNIGMNDYRYFPLSRYYPVEQQRLFNNLYKYPEPYNNYENKTVNVSFRGKINKNSNMYSFQRNYIIKLLEKLNDEKFVTGQIIGRGAYLNELKESKVCLSPFGYGEVCYRDFEGILCGSLLMKPSMAHIETFPNIYIENQTYIKLNWDMSDLEEKLIQVLEQMEDFYPIITAAQNKYLESVSDFSNFKKTFLDLIN